MQLTLLVSLLASLALPFAAAAAAPMTAHKRVEALRPWVAKPKDFDWYRCDTTKALESCGTLEFCKRARGNNAFVLCIKTFERLPSYPAPTDNRVQLQCLSDPGPDEKKCGTFAWCNAADDRRRPDWPWTHPYHDRFECFWAHRMTPEYWGGPGQGLRLRGTQSESWRR
ncbi:hypothetical protein PLIIFM63780_004909 [Purpureocillium lilacinum]|uniref:Uncharacterized protein n=1 Tax=Purpureocillium lilacinum TaxID=33203 RepID=A0A179H9A2_PURLI|nr:hypothetical protein VFPBJ_00318 [Purpureocillium lilacinum]GJN67468.1 hypothetical protein PLICBS_001494 [Purpureocillium lilacinum]GJN81375.1 hypothetical protein PLIIFM63780_004909 [Purpureocillium lilacinum]